MVAWNNIITRMTPKLEGLMSLKSHKFLYHLTKQMMMIPLYDWLFNVFYAHIPP